MRTAMRPRYYCDHCNKGNGSPSATALSASESRVQALQREVEELRARMPNLAGVFALVWAVYAVAAAYASKLKEGNQ